MTEQLYVKRGRRYLPWGNAEDWDREKDVMKIGTFRLIHCPEPGHYRYRYDVTPDSAAWVAAAMVAENAMQKAIVDASIARPSSHGSHPYTPEQQRIIEQFRIDMAAAGGLVPSYWTHNSPIEIAEAGINAVKRLQGDHYG